MKNKAFFFLSKYSVRSKYTIRSSLWLNSSIPPVSFKEIHIKKTQKRKKKPNCFYNQFMQWGKSLNLHWCKANDKCVHLWGEKCKSSKPLRKQTQAKKKKKKNLFTGHVQVIAKKLSYKVSGKKCPKSI